MTTGDDIDTRSSPLGPESVTQDGAARTSAASFGPAPARIGRYHVLERLGADGMGVVFAAYDPELDRKVAVKLLRPDRNSGDSQVRLLREAQALARLSHPNVVQVHDAGALDERVFLAMEFIRGVDLRAWLGTARRGEAEVMRVFLAAGRGLAAAHAQGVVHRDFKPENVLVGDDGRVCVADFGLARVEVGSASMGGRGTALALLLTDSGALLGTPAYMAPEQHLGRPSDARSDQFSFCVALWEALFGQRPFAGDTASETAAAVVAGELRSPPADRRLSRHVLEALRRGLQVDPGARFPTVDALLAALARDPARSRRRWLLVPVFAGMMFGTAYFARDDAAEACSGAARELAGVWDADRRAAVTAALAGAADPELPARVLAGLDGRAAAWVTARREACLDHHAGRRSPTLYDAHARCLDRRRQELNRAVDLLVTDHASVDAARLVARLPAVGACTDAGIAEAEAARPDDPLLARAAAALADELSAARTHHHGGDEVAAERMTATVVAKARRLELRPLLAEALLLRGHVLAAVDQLDDAREAMREAVVHALATRRDALAAEALAVQLFLDGQLDARAKALAAAPMARALAERLVAPAAALARLDNNLGTLAFHAGELDEARAYFERATAELARVEDPDRIELANYQANLALSTRDPAAKHDGFTRAIAVLSGALGMDHLETLHLRLRHGLHEADLTQGAAILAAVCPRLRALYPEVHSSCASCFQRLGLTEAELGRDEAALAAFRAVPGCLGAPGNHMQAEHFAVLGARSGAAIAWIEARPAEALALADDALARAEPHQAMWWVALEVAELQVLRGRALVALGRTTDARVTLERAATLIAELSRGHTDALLPVWAERVRSLQAAIAG
ncbi:protein kinase domain-containing protein [Nannocystis pusilla]|uniref:Serine/threonine-protein kinase n=1 Tax=Nannocystis pusilla TaxID=889268 RepID=A0ABS7TU07_9BACT|nr:serine/threonine-protein kinase [Nannocystis pusilla]